MKNIPQNSGADPGTDPLVHVQVRLPKSLDRQIEIIVAHRDWTKQALVEAAVRAYLESKVA